VEAVASSTDRIVLLPYQSDRHELARVLASADIYLTAGPHETFALSVVEAQASGLPVIGVRAGALLERVPESVGLLGEVDSAAAMAENIVMLSSNGLRAKGRQARRVIERTLTWESSISRLLETYERLRSR
jgi:alpha-1,6-mannosyltransferase